MKTFKSMCQIAMVSAAVLGSGAMAHAARLATPPMFVADGQNFGCAVEVETVKGRAVSIGIYDANGNVADMRHLIPVASSGKGYLEIVVDSRKPDVTPFGAGLYSCAFNTEDKTPKSALRATGLLLNTYNNVSRGVLVVIPAN